MRTEIHTEPLALEAIKAPQRKSMECPDAAPQPNNGSPSEAEEIILEGVVTEEIPVSPRGGNEELPAEEGETDNREVPTIFIPPLTLPQRSFWQRIRLPVLIVLTVAGCLGLGILINLLWLIPAQATILLTPQRVQRSFTLALDPAQVSLRALPPFEQHQRTTEAATGKGYHPASAAHGWITLYNAALAPQTIAAGTLLTGHDGVQVLTDATITIPAGALGVEGRGSILAHAAQSGPEGNISAGDLTGPCCRENIFADNTTFTGGGNAYVYHVVTTQDIQTATATLKDEMQQHTPVAFQQQLLAGETLTLPVCTWRTTSSQPAGAPAEQVTVSLQEQCTAQAYNATQMQTLAAHALTTGSPAGYVLMGDAQIQVERQTGTRWTILLSGTLEYQWTATNLHHLALLLAGKTRAQALLLLQAQPGIAAAHLDIQGRDTSHLPTDPARLVFSVLA